MRLGVRGAGLSAAPQQAGDEGQTDTEAAGDLSITPLVAYHFRRWGTVPPDWIPVFYAVAMGTDAVAALVFGHLFDRRGVPVLLVACLLSSLSAPLALWGLLPGDARDGPLGHRPGSQKAILKASVARMVTPGRRGSAYGLFHTAYGIAWFLGSTLMGLLYETSLAALVALSIVSQLAAIPLLLLAVSRHDAVGVAEPGPDEKAGLRRAEQ